MDGHVEVDPPRCIARQRGESLRQIHRTAVRAADLVQEPRLVERGELRGVAVRVPRDKRA